MEEIKCCPFCGNKASLTKQVRLCKRNESMVPDHDIEVSWKIECRNCGTSKESFGSTYYNITNDGEFEITPQYYNDKEKANPSDKRIEVIERWNERHN